MRSFLFNPNTVGSGLLGLVGVAMTVGGWLNPIIAYVILGTAVIWFISASIYWRRSRKERDLTKDTIRPKSAIGGLIGRASEVKIRDSHSKVKVIVSGKPEEVVIGGLIGQSENAEVVNCSADAEIEYEQDGGCGKGIPS